MGRPGRTSNKAMVPGAIQRGGEVRLKMDKRSTKRILHRFIKMTTDPDAERIITDERRSYRGIQDEDTKHETVNHGAKEWVRGDVHTNTVESVFSLFKRSVIGAFHHVSKKHLDAYLDEFEWRLNNRENPFLFRDTLARLLTSAKMEFKELVEKSA